MSSIARAIGDFAWQMRLLMWKQYLLCYHGKKQLSLQVLSPVLFILVLFVCSFISMAHDHRDAPKRAEPTIPLCRQRGKLPCTTVAYSYDSAYTASARVLSAAQIDSVMADVLSNNPSLKSSDFTKYNTSTEMYKFIKSNPNRTYIGVMFYPVDTPTRVTDMYAPNTTLGKVPYTIVVNDTLPETDLTNNVFEATAYHVEKALLRALLNSTSASGAPDFTNSRYPRIYKQKKFDAMSYVSPIMLYNPTMFNFMLLLYQIVQEKELHLRRQMKAVGMSDLAYWLTFFMFNVLVVFLATLVTMLAGAIFQFAFFIKANFFAVFLTFFLFGLAMTPFAVLLSMLITTTRTAVNFGMAVFLFGVIVQIIASSSVIMQQFYKPSFPSAIPSLLQLWPPFNFAKLIIDISSKTSQSDLHTKGATFFSWDDMYQSTTLGTDWVYPAPKRAAIWQCIDCLIFTGISVVLYNIMPEEGGWFVSFIRQKRAARNVNKKLQEVELDVVDDEDVHAEEQFAESDKSPVPVKIKHFSKTYTTGSCGGGRSVHAVKDISMTVHDNEILALLGHNGCGKSTTMNALSCMLAPSYGDMTVCGSSVVNSPDGVRQVIGVCPQDDVLWPDLTAVEHLKIFGRLKRVPLEQLDNEIKERLSDVGLFDVGNRAAGTFSGGMKRRLSVAISCVGNPKFLLLDEPTTGLDPVARRQMWASLQKLKEGRSVLLTTHSMEEAEALGDRIAIMRSGKIRCIGVPLHLKAKYGAGYVLNAVSKPDREADAVALIRVHLPSAVPITQVNGNLKYGVPSELLPQLSELMTGIEKEGATSPIKEWGVSQTTIEEVFLRVCHGEQQSHSPAQSSPSD